LAPDKNFLSEQDKTAEEVTSNAINKQAIQTETNNIDVVNAEEEISDEDEYDTVDLGTSQNVDMNKVS